MKDSKDIQTIDAFATGKRRGRPPTGQARTAAQRKAAQRERDRQAVWSSHQLHQASNEALALQLAWCVGRRGCADYARELAGELLRRCDAT